LADQTKKARGKSYQQITRGGGGDEDLGKKLTVCGSCSRADSTHLLQEAKRQALQKRETASVIKYFERAARISRPASGSFLNVV